MRRFSRGFTLVELLVVIGIIALLISILLPGLSAARRQANQVKCATQMRELGNAFRLYSLEYRNYYPPALLNHSAASFAAGPRYEIDGIVYPIQAATAPVRIYGAYWFNFVNKYISKTAGGIGSSSLQDQQQFRRSIVWGCAAFDGYGAPSGTSVDVNPTQPGYGMNFTPYWTLEGGSDAVNALNSPITDANIAKGTGFIKSNIWGRNSAQRMLLVDNALYLADAPAPPTDGSIGLHSGDQNVTRDAKGTYVSLWRHGKMPRTGMTITSNSNMGWYPVNNGGKVAFNILYCDGHVNLESDPKLAYSTQRMKFPR